MEAKTSRRQVILGCINLYDPPWKAVTVRLQQLKQETGTLCLICRRRGRAGKDGKTEEKDGTRFQGSLRALNTNEGAMSCNICDKIHCSIILCLFICYRGNWDSSCERIWSWPQTKKVTEVLSFIPSSPSN
ncbi:hypothetical protein D5086_024452 [Populus alba]|uniref:Uncharacterized protein n=2 Tax=Populus TaxID=3689 RepID=A0ACC4B5G5_POPAL|nr:hypothetical protein NC653_030946 [Populus alba x Populus x berolinensis]